MRLSSILRTIDQERTRLSVVVLDCCRTTPYSSNWGGYGAGGYGQTGFAAVNAPAGSLIAYSTSPGKTASDGPSGGNSPYAKALAAWITQPGLTVEEVFKHVREAVLHDTYGKQRPWESTSLTGNFYLVGRTSEPTPAVAAKKSRLLRRFQGQAGQIDSVGFSPTAAWLAARVRTVVSMLGTYGLAAGNRFPPLPDIGGLLSRLPFHRMAKLLRVRAPMAA